MASIPKFACIVLSVFLSLGLSMSHRFLLDHANDDHKNRNLVHHDAVKNPEGVGVGIGAGLGNGSIGYGSGTGEGFGSGGSHNGSGIGVGSGPGGSGYGAGEGVGHGSGNAPGCVPGISIHLPIAGIGITIPIPAIPGLPECCDCGGSGQTESPISNCNPTKIDEPGNCLPKPTPAGGSATAAAKGMQEAINYITSEPYPPDIDPSRP